MVSIKMNRCFPKKMNVFVFEIFQEPTPPRSLRKESCTVGGSVAASATTACMQRTNQNDWGTTRLSPGRNSSTSVVAGRSRWPSLDEVPYGVGGNGPMVDWGTDPSHDWTIERSGPVMWAPLERGVAAEGTPTPCFVGRFHVFY
jgi:hypothetical protein